jgi:hypothetical protein
VRTFALAVSLLASRGRELARLVGAKFPLAAWPEALRSALALRSPPAIKTVFDLRPAAPATEPAAREEDPRRAAGAGPGVVPA